MSKPLVSIIVLAYNAEKTFDATMRSLVNQRCDFSFEIVVGEDASQDGTRTIAGKWAENYPELIRLMPAAPNKGLVRNYFDCLDACRGDFVTDCSAGDMFAPADRLQNLASVLNENEDVVAVFTDAEGFEFNDEPTIENYLSPSGHGQIVLSAMMFRASVVKESISKRRETVINEKYGCEDVSVICTLLASGKVVKSESGKFIYNCNGESVSRPLSPAAEMRFHLSTLYAISSMAKFYDCFTPRVKKKLRCKLNHLADIAFLRFDGELYGMWKEAYGMMPGRRGVKASLKNMFIRLTGVFRR